MHSDEHLVACEQGLQRVRSIRRRATEAERWDRSVLNVASGLPTNPSGPNRGLLIGNSALVDRRLVPALPAAQGSAPQVATPAAASAQGEPESQLASAEPAPAAAGIDAKARHGLRYQDFVRAAGKATGCKACDRPHGRSHTSACRKRFATCSERQSAGHADVEGMSAGVPPGISQMPTQAPSAVHVPGVGSASASACAEGHVAVVPDVTMTMGPQAGGTSSGVGGPDITDVAKELGGVPLDRPANVRPRFDATADPDSASKRSRVLAILASDMPGTEGAWEQEWFGDAPDGALIEQAKQKELSSLDSLGVFECCTQEEVTVSGAGLFLTSRWVLKEKEPGQWKARSVCQNLLVGADLAMMCSHQS